MTDQLDEAAAFRSGKDSPHPSTGDLTAAVSGGAGMRTPASGPPRLSLSISPASAEAGTLLFPPMKDKTSGSFLSRAQTSPIRHVNLVHIMEEQMHEAEDGSIGHESTTTVGEKRHWQCHNHIDPALKDVIRHMCGNNIPLSQVYGVLCDLHGGSEALPFRKRSLKSTCIQIAHEASQDDINKLMDMFAKAQLDNGDFFHSVDTDADRRVRSIFWCHAKARADYICFGDVVTFDTTYKCNLYEMPCLTDMCRQMELAIHEEMPNTVHRWCKWHVLKNMRENLGPLYGKDKPFKRDLDFVLNEMMTVDEFEEAWEQIVSEYDLSGSTYIKQVYDCRDKWAKPFFKGQFCAKMTSTQRNECMNHVLKTYVSRSAPLNRFFMQYTKLITNRCGEEDAEQSRTKQVGKYYYLTAGVTIENHAYSVYTHAMFRLFSEILFKSGSFIVKGPPEGGLGVLEHFDAERRAKYFKVKYEVQVNLAMREFTCECGLFEHTGMLCRHVLKSMVHYGVSKIPSRYIMKRWTRDARDILPEEIRCYQRDSEIGVSKTYRNNILYMKALEIVRLGDVSLETFAVAMRHLDRTKKELIAESEKITPDGQGAEGSVPNSMPTAQDGNTQKEATPENLNHYGSNQEEPPTDEANETEVNIPAFDDVDARPGFKEVFKTPENRLSHGRPVTRRMQSRAESARGKGKGKSMGKGKEKAVCAICRSEEHEMSNCHVMDVEPYTEYSNNNSAHDSIYWAAEADEFMVEKGDLGEDTDTTYPTPTPISTNLPKSNPSIKDSDLRTMSGKAKPPSTPRRYKLCGEVGHYAPKCPLNEEPRAPVASPVCKKCGLTGHMKNTYGRESSYKRR